MSRRTSAFSALIAIDKPAGMTSHDVVSRVRRAVGERRVGHAGTLDPAATGVLVVGIGQATKLLGLLTLDRKGYRATFALGAETTTDDAEGDVTANRRGARRTLLDRERATAEVERLVGEQDQVPPRFSAVSVNGRRAYDAARAGEDVELSARRVTIFDARLVGVVPDERSWVVDLDVSKGTYVRSIARDLGRELGCLAHVSELRRTFSGPVTLGDCLGLDELAERGAGPRARAGARPPPPCSASPSAELALDEVRRRHVRAAHRTRHPARRARAGPRPARRARLLRRARRHLATRGRPRLVCESNFPQGIEGVR